MPKIKPLGTPKVIKPPLTKLEKAELRATKMLANEKKAKDEHQTKQYQQYVEYKLIKGHSQAAAEKMARAMIYHQKEV